MHNAPHMYICSLVCIPDPFSSYTTPNARTNITNHLQQSHLPIYLSIDSPNHTKNHVLPRPHSPKKGPHPVPNPINPPNPSTKHNNPPINTNNPHTPNKSNTPSPPPDLPLSPTRPAPRPLLHKLPNSNPHLRAHPRPDPRLLRHSTNPRRTGRRLPRRLSATTPARRI